MRIPYMHSALFVCDVLLPDVRERAHRASRSAAQRERVSGNRRGPLASETPDQRTSGFELGRALAQ